MVDLSSFGLSELTQPWWTAYAAFTEKAWFSRVWTAQEVIVSQDARLVCGDRELPWDIFKECIELCEWQAFLLASIYSPRQPSSRGSKQSARRQVTGISIYRDLRNNYAEIRFAKLVALFRNCDSTLPAKLCSDALFI